MGKTLETAKDTVATTVESVKHEVENVVKDKTEMLEDAKNTLMEKLHLKANESEGHHGHDDDDAGHKIEEKEEHVSKMETDELKTQLNENLKHSSDSKTEDEADVTKDIKEHTLKRIDTETDSLSTSITEPEIEQAFAKSHDDIEKNEEELTPTTTKNLTALDNLKAAALKLQQQQEKDEALTAEATTKMVNDINMLNDHPAEGHESKDHESATKLTDSVTKSNNMQ